MTPASVQVRRAQRWFWGLLVLAVLAMGALYRAIQQPAGPAAGLTLLLTGTVLILASVQAARILRALRGPARLPWRGGASRVP